MPISNLSSIKVTFVNANSFAVRGTVGALSNVDEAEKNNGNTLVYYSANTTYVLQSPNNLNITEIDGGEF